MKTLPRDIHEKIAKEFRFAADKMAEAPDLATKSYFFSAFFGEVQRALNYEWNPDFALLHLAMQSAHQSIKGRIDLAMTGIEPGIGFPVGFNEIYTQFAQDLASLMEGPHLDDAQFYSLLRRAAVLAYSVTGNGYYLYAKGVLTLDEPNAPELPSAQSLGGDQE